MRFCHAVGFGFLLFRAVELDLPAAGPWEDLIARLVDALDASPPHRPLTDRPPTRGTTDMTTNEEMLGRADVNDLEAILSITSNDVDEVVHAVKDNADAHLHVGLREGRAPGAQQALREGQGRRSGTARPTCRGTLEVDIEKVVANAPRDPDADPVFVAAQRAGPAARTTGATRSGTSSSSSRRTGR